MRFIQSAQSGRWKKEWIWAGPNWKDINDKDTSAVGFVTGPALSPEAKTALDEFIEDLASDKVKLFKGPLDYQDGSSFLKEGEIASDKKIWYMEQLLEGMEGQSQAKK